MKKILIFGIYGLLGNNIYVKLKNKYIIYGTCRIKLTKEKNIFNFEHNKINIYNIINKIKPDIIINCIAMLREKNLFDKEMMIYSNSIIPIIISQICVKKNIYFIHFSTDAVFNNSNILNGINDINNPDTFYGYTKVISEYIKDISLVLRVCPIGYSKYNNRSLFNFIYNNSNKDIKGYTNCYFNGSTTLVIIKELEKIIDSNYLIYGIRHISTEKISKYDLLVLINKIFNLNKYIIKDDNITISRFLKNDLINYKTSWENQIKELYFNMNLFLKN